MFAWKTTDLARHRALMISHNSVGAQVLATPVLHLMCGALAPLKHPCCLQCLLPTALLLLTRWCVVNLIVCGLRGILAQWCQVGE